MSGSATFSDETALTTVARATHMAARTSPRRRVPSPFPAAMGSPPGSSGCRLQRAQAAREHPWLVVAGLDPRRDHEPVPGVDRGDREDELAELVVLEGRSRALPYRIRNLS